MIRLRIEGLMLERLLERAIAQGASVRRALRDGPRAMVLDTGMRGERILRALCQRHSLRLETLCVTGVHALLRHARRRWTLLPGLALCFALLFVYAQRIWRVDVAFVGDRPPSLSAQDVLSMLYEAGVRPGMAAKDVDTQAIELSLSARSDALSFVGARRQGVRLLVEVAPSLEAPELYEADAARDLVAACDGVVVSVNALSGVPAVEPGDTVRRGDVLIRGEERAGAEATRGVAALGEVIARTWVETYAEAPRTRAQRVYTGRTSERIRLRLLENAWTLSDGESFALCEQTTLSVPLVGLFLPLELERTTRFECAEELVDVDEEALMAELSERAFELADAEIAQIGANPLQIVDKWIDYSMIEEGIVRARAVVELHRNIACTRDALLQEG